MFDQSCLVGVLIVQNVDHVPDGIPERQQVFLLQTAVHVVIFEHIGPDHAERTAELGTAAWIPLRHHAVPVRPGPVEEIHRPFRQTVIFYRNISCKTFQPGIAHVHELFVVGAVHVGLVGTHLQAPEHHGDDPVQVVVRERDG